MELAQDHRANQCRNYDLKPGSGNTKIHVFYSVPTAYANQKSEKMYSLQEPKGKKKDSFSDNQEFED